jgi:hypothetical protein
MSKWMKLAGVALAFGIAQPAMAANCATVSFTVPSLPQFNPISGGYSPQTITANVTRADNKVNVVRLVLLDADSATTFKLQQSGPIYDITSGSSSILHPSTYNIGIDDGALINLSGNTGSTNLTFSIQNLTNTSTEFVGGVQYPEPLSYSVQCYNTAGASGKTDVLGKDERVSAFSASVTIAKIVSITTAGPQTIDFGNFTTTSQQLQVGVKSTSSINVDVATSRGNQMVLAGAVSPFPATSTIPYTMTLNGTSVSNGTSLTNQTRAGVAGMNWPLVLNLTGGLPTGKIAGSYSDTITLTLTPGI